MNKIIGIYKITNTITGDFYIGSSKDVKHRWSEHKCPSTREKFPNNQLYQDMQKLGVDKFAFEILAEVESDKLKETEQEFIEKLKPTYNSNNANGWDVERYKETKKEYEKTDKRKKYHKEYYQQNCEAIKEYYNQLCYYNGQTITLNALSARFRSQGIPHPVLEAKKYLINN